MKTSLALLLSCFSAMTALPTDGLAKDDQIATPEPVSRQDRFAGTVDDLNKAIAELEANESSSKLCLLLNRRANAYLQLGQTRLALKDLEQIGTRLPKEAPLPQRAAFEASLGNAYLAVGRLSDAETHLREAVKLAEASGTQKVLGATLNNLGNVYAAEQKAAEARQAYAEVTAAAKRFDDNELAATGLINQARLEQQLGQKTTAGSLLDTARTRLTQLTPGSRKTDLLINIGQLLLDAGRTEDAHEILNQAQALAISDSDWRNASYALGYLARLDELRGQKAVAVHTTQQAIRYAQRIKAPELLYLWYWQTGKLYREPETLRQAVDAYRSASYFLEQVRDDLTVSVYGGASPYRQRVSQLYLELADLLLQQAAQEPTPTRKQQLLLEARNTVETLKAAELQNYFLDECVVKARSNANLLDHLSATTAVIYPVLLPERTELLVSFADGIRQFTIPVAGETITTEVRNFRRLLNRLATNEYRKSAKSLYKWLLQPVQSVLNERKIDTLVIVPDGSLRTVPLAALMDDEGFIAKRYAVATTPGLTLTDASPLKRQEAHVLLTGLTEAVQGFPALPAVSNELNSVQTIVGEQHWTLLKNDAFILQNFAHELTSRPYSIVHIASHGQFSSDQSKSFLLTFQERMTMDRLEEFMQYRRYSDDPVELLTLSACQTAAGDDRAALGFSGLAIKAGARSALGTLWFVNDEASSILIADFYRNLRTPTLSKAKALQQAQLNLMQDRRFQHPGYWAPYLLIGNWL